MGSTPNTSVQASHFIPFREAIDGYDLPERFTFPFYYEPHPLSRLAVKELSHYLQHQDEWEHNFGLEPSKEGMVIGKMFGVLVVQTSAGDIGYLAAFSGKLADSNHHARFVPPVFDMLTEGSFFKEEEAVLNELNRQIEALEAAPVYLQCQKLLAEETALAAEKIEAHKRAIKEGKQARKTRRQEAKASLSAEAYQALEAELIRESQMQKIELKKLSLYWKERLAQTQATFDQFLAEIETLKSKRKQKSAALQQRLFEQYQFLNQYGERKSLRDIFADQAPPAGAGECAAPKLLHYAFQHQLKPIAMAEFWWGQSHKSEIRKHGHFYPACRGKCEPILAHMLQGIEMDDNPMLDNPAEGKELEIVYEDEHLLIINKPAEFLSVPGKTIRDSVQYRMQQQFPNATGPLVVHRLDMSTSGLMLIAKTKEVHQKLQRQFIKRTVKKRYIALLEGIVERDEGVIDLPLRVDLDDRPRQLVCYDYGKAARTEWKVVERSDQRTRIHFFPVTGRTHQLRVHAAHALGLNTPITGDDLYGHKGERLHLHAEAIEFVHPVSKQIMEVEAKAAF